ncbi:hypothetical protein ALC53_10006 [Atta colombica]|uniref:Uncharacterized protein n=1 Tax=Atta colombica TaxID=520822 RepID=A0A195B5M8_9HYME|nr:hypothetical protein ALC53_10006 [Atta colombica]
MKTADRDTRAIRVQRVRNTLHVVSHSACMLRCFRIPGCLDVMACPTDEYNGMLTGNDAPGPQSEIIMRNAQPLLFAVHGTKDPYMVLAYYLCCTHTDALQELLSEMLVSNRSEVTIYACQTDQPDRNFLSSY